MTAPGRSRVLRFAAVAAMLIVLAACTAIGASRPRETYRRLGSVEVRTDGAVIEHAEIDGSIDVYASNVTVRNVRILCGAYWCVRSYEGATHLTVEDADIGPRRPRSTTDGLWVQSFTGRRLDIHGVSDGVKAWSDVRLEDSHIHDLTQADDDHSDGVQVQGGSDIVMARNRIEGGTNSALFLSTDAAPIADVAVRDNALGGGAYTFGLRVGPYGPPQRVVVERNVFLGDAQYGPIIADAPTLGSGNVDLRTGRTPIRAGAATGGS